MKRMIKRIAFTTALALLAVLLWAVPGAAKEVVRSFHQQIPVESAGRIHLDFPVGEVQVAGWNNRQVDLDVKITCNEPTGRCESAARRLRVVFNRADGQLEIRIADWPSMAATKGLNVDAVLRVPRNLPLRADLSVGKLTIDGIAADVTADLGVGEVHVTLPKEAIGSANIDAGIGEASLVAAGRRYTSAGLIVRAIHWDKGQGRGRVKVDCGVGEIHVTLA
jgi:hypothetical protein